MRYCSVKQVPTHAYSNINLPLKNKKLEKMKIGIVDVVITEYYF